MEDVRIVKINVNNNTGDVSLYLLNNGGINSTIDYTYVENLFQNMLFLNKTNPTDPNRYVPVGDTATITFTAFNASILNQPLVFKVVTTSGVASSYLWSPATSSIVQPPGGSSGSNITQFSITVTKYNDTNANGIVDSQDYPLPNYPIILVNPDNTSVIQTTNSNGTAVFTGLNKGTYVVKDVIGNISAYPGVNWSCTNLTAIADVSITSSNQSVVFLNAIVNPIYSIRGIVYNDTNDDGNITGHSPMSSSGVWTVIAVDSNNNVYFADTHWNNGTYVISSLPSGAYRVREILLSQNYVITYPNAPPNSTYYPLVRITNSSISSPQCDFGDYKFATGNLYPYWISGMVFLDNSTSHNATAPGGGGLSGRLITLVYTNGSGTTYGAITDANGNFSFNVNADNYTVIQLLPLYWQSSTLQYILTISSNVSNCNFGDWYAPPKIYFINGTVFNDTNNNGVYDPGPGNDLPLSNWIVTYNDTDGLHSILTDANGTYSTLVIAPGYTYELTVSLTSPYYSNSTWANTTAVTIDIPITNSSVYNQNFGLKQIIYSNITALVFNDKNLNKIYDTGIDSPLQGWNVWLNLTYKATTDANGNANFTNIPTGFYNLTEEIPNGWTNDTNSVVTVNLTAVPLLVPFGNYYNGTKTITGLVFNDTDQTGNSTGKPPLAGVVVNLLSKDGYGYAVTTTNSSGYYSFTGLKNGTWFVYLTLNGTYSTWSNSTAKNVTEIVNVTDIVDTVNFGLWVSKSYEIYGMKFNDTLGTGVYNQNYDNPIANWTFYLYSGVYNGSQNPIANLTTNSLGYFDFNYIANGTYSVAEGSQIGWINTTLAIQSVIINGASNTTLMFGNNNTGLGTGSNIYFIGGRVYNDTDGSHSWTPGENGTSGVTVVLENSLSNPINFTQTNSLGNYTFSNIANGTYFVVLLTPNGYTNTTSTRLPVTIAGFNSYGNDFGIQKTGSTPIWSISGFVFNDSNDNGTWDANESGLVNWTILLYNGTYSAGAQPWQIANTSSGGGYYFYVPNGNYTVIEDLNGGWVNTTARSFFDTVNNISVTNPNMGDYLYSAQTYNISGIVFNDTNFNGKYDGSDAGYNGIYVWLCDNSGLPITYFITGSGGVAGKAGIYNFTSLVPGTYSIYVGVPGGYYNTTPSLYTITIGPSNTTINFGFALINHYFISGYKNIGSTAYTKGWIVWLYAGNYGTGIPTNIFPVPYPIAQLTTSATGLYNFTGLANGTYTVIESWNSSYTNSTPVAVVKVIAGSGYNNVNFTNVAAVVGAYNISGWVYNDSDSSGNWTPGENGLSLFAYIYIQNATTGFPMMRLTATATGNFTFTGLSPGTYNVYVQVPAVTPAGWYNTSLGMQTITVTTANVGNVLFGMHNPNATLVYSIYGLKYNATSGVNTPISGWTINLYSGVYTLGKSPTSIQNTTAAGTYNFTNLVAGTYTVIELPQSGWINATNRAVIVTVGPSQNVTFGNSIPSSGTFTIGGSVWNDSNKNGKIDNGEVGVQGMAVNISISDVNGPYFATMTNAAGNYSFGTLPAGTYYVTITVPTGWTSTSATNITVIVGPSNSTINFGIYNSTTTTYTISGFKYNDTGMNGTYVGQAGINSYPILLYQNTSGGFPKSTTTTSGNGNFSFTGLANGTYYVIDPEVNGYGAIATMQRNVTIVINGASNSSVIFGNYLVSPTPPYSISGFVFNDSDGSGVYNTGDSPYSGGATIWLKDQYGIPISYMTTNSTGNYTFSGLPNGTYTVYIQMSLLSGWTASTNTSFTYTISGSSIIASPFGIYKTKSYTISGVVFNDTNQNGVQNAGENGVPYWNNILLESGGIPISTNVTDANGNFAFTSLSNGTYTIVENMLNETSWVNTTSTQIVVVISGNSNNSINFGDYQPVAYSISGKVYNDSNGNQLYTPGVDTNLTGWTVKLYNNGTFVTSTTTDSNGNYSFPSLSNGTYSVQAVISNVTFWNNDTPSSLNVLISGNSVGGQNFGMALLPHLYSISGYVWNDTSTNNGVYDPGSDNLIPSWTLQLVYPNGTMVLNLTGTTGYYTFSNLPPNNYTVREGLPTGWSNITARVQYVTIVNASNSTINFGNVVNNTLVTTYTLNGVVYNDSNDNGVQNSGEGGMSGWYVSLSYGTNTLLTQTDSNGNYIFIGLLPGNYTVQDYPLTGWINTTAAAVTVNIVTMNASGINFGNYYNKHNVAGYVFFDANADHVYEIGTDFPLAGWNLNLTNIGTGSKTYTTTDSNGYYSFLDMAGGNYTLSVMAAPQGWANNTAASVSINLNASYSVNFSYVRSFFSGLYETLTHSQWSTDAGGYLANNFSQVYQSQGFVSIGIGGQSLFFTDPALMKTYLANSLPPLGQPLSSIILWTGNNQYNGTAPGIALGANILALQLNIDYNNYSPTIGPFSNPIGGLTYYNLTGDSMSGKTLSQILSIADQVIGGVNITTVAPGYTYDSLNTLLGQINSAFSGGSLTFANAHLF